MPNSKKSSTKKAKKKAPAKSKPAPMPRANLYPDSNYLTEAEYEALKKEVRESTKVIDKALAELRAQKKR